MSNKNFDSISIPINIDEAIQHGADRAKHDIFKNRLNKFRKIAIASIVLVCGIGMFTPSIAAKLPFIGSVFESIEKNIYFPGNFSQYATSVNETAYSNGIGITLSEVLCDGQSLYVTYVVENEEPFKNTSWGNGKKLDMNQLIIADSYSKVDFSNKELDSTGFAGLEGKFIDEHTFVGVQKYHLTSLDADIPDEFELKTKIVNIDNYAVNVNEKDYEVSGTWAFKIPVKVNRELKKNVDVKGIENNFIKIDSISITPFDMIVDVEYKKGIWSEYTVRVYDENNKTLKYGQTIASDNGKNERFLYEAPIKDSNYIKIVINKRNSNEVVLEEVIYLNK